MPYTPYQKTMCLKPVHACPKQRGGVIRVGWCEEEHARHVSDQFKKHPPGNKQHFGQSANIKINYGLVTCFTGIMLICVH